ncbi:hypothetical protein NIES4101_66750 [Calothrix sp. NIES-4101]|nr:hypothetical protein NIES4101_66750 [Calothrix sp. NIES-4101]
MGSIFVRATVAPLLAVMIVILLAVSFISWKSLIEADHAVAAEFFNLDSATPGNLLVYQCQLFLMEKEY